MRTDGITDDVPVSFTCPKCDRRGTYKLMYVPKCKDVFKGRKVKVSTVCRCKNCEYTVTLTYCIHKTVKGQYRLKVLSCRGNKKWYRNKRYQLTQKSP